MYFSEIRSYSSLYLDGWRRPPKGLRVKDRFVTMPLCIGWDTETVHGKLRLSCLSDTDGEISHRFFEECDTSDATTLLEQLTFRDNRTLRVGRPDKVVVAYNLKYDAQALFRHLPRRNLSELVKDGSTVYEQFEIQWLDKKRLFIKDTSFKGVGTHIFDIGAFYTGSLDKNSRQFLHDRKKGSGLDMNVLGKDASYWDDKLDTIIEYCYHDARLTAGLTDVFLRTFQSSFDFYPKDLYSPGYVANLYLIKTLKTHYPNIRALFLNNPDLGKYAFAAYFGARIEMYGMGRFEGCYSYDLNSAYPATMKELPSFTETNGIWFPYDEKEGAQALIDSEIHGVYQIEYTSSDSHFGILPFRKEQALYFPTGEPFRSFITTPELRLIDRLRNEGRYQVDYTIIGGWEFKPFPECIYPYKDVIDMLFALKAEGRATGDINKEHIAKIEANSLYGKTAQINFRDVDGVKRGVPANSFNPLVASIITAETRCKTMEAALNVPNPEDVIYIATDSITTRVPIPDLPMGARLGEWKEEHHNVDVISIQPGVKAVYKDGELVEEKTRGLPLKPGMLDEYLHDPKNKRKRSLTFKTLKALSLKEAHSRKDSRVLDAFNDLLPSEKVISLDDNKRVWGLNRIKTVQDLITRGSISVALRPSFLI